MQQLHWQSSFFINGTQARYGWKAIARFTGKVSYTGKANPLNVHMRDLWEAIVHTFTEELFIQNFTTTHSTFDKLGDVVGSLVVPTKSCPREPVPTKKCAM